MYSRVCKDFPNIADKSNSFVKGNNSFYLNNIKSHDQTTTRLYLARVKPELHK